MKSYNKIVLIIHLIFWTLDGGYDYFQYDRTLFVYAACLGYHMILFYINYFIIAKYTLKEPTLIRISQWAIIYLVFLFFGLWLGDYIYHFLLLKDYVDIELIKITKWTLTWFFYYSAVSTGTRIFVNWAQNNEETHLLNIKKSHQQLQLLKNKINIPFLLEVLEILEKKAIKKPSAIQGKIIELSNILRYTLYESNTSSTKLHKEVEILTEYLDLLRNIKQLNIKLSNTIQDNIHIPTGILLKTVSTLINHNINFSSIELTKEKRHFFFIIDIKKNNTTIKLATQLQKEFPYQLDIHFSPLFKLKLS